MQRVGTSWGVVPPNQSTLHQIQQVQLVRFAQLHDIPDRLAAGTGYNATADIANPGISHTVHALEPVCCIKQKKLDECYDANDVSATWPISAEYKDEMVVGACCSKNSDRTVLASIQRNSNGESWRGRNPAFALLLDLP